MRTNDGVSNSWQARDTASTTLILGASSSKCGKIYISLWRRRSAQMAADGAPMTWMFDAIIRTAMLVVIIAFLHQNVCF
jgi:hypothetical protein